MAHAIAIITSGNTATANMIHRTYRYSKGERIMVGTSKVETEVIADHLPSSKLATAYFETQPYPSRL